MIAASDDEGRAGRFFYQTKLSAPGTVGKNPDAWCGPRQRQAGWEASKLKPGDFLSFPASHLDWFVVAVSATRSHRMELLRTRMQMSSPVPTFPQAVHSTSVLGEVWSLNTFWPGAQWTIPRAFPARLWAALLAHHDKLCSHFVVLIAPLQRVDLLINNLTKESRQNYPDENMGCWPLFPVSQSSSRWKLRDKSGNLNRYRIQFVEPLY